MKSTFSPTVEVQSLRRSSLELDEALIEATEDLRKSCIDVSIEKFKICTKNFNSVLNATN